MLTWPQIVIGIALYIGAAMACGEVFEAIGNRDNPKYGSWTGDYSLDTWSIILWPLSLVILLGMKAGRAVARAVVDG